MAENAGEMSGATPSSTPSRKKRSIVVNLSLLVVISIVIASAVAYIATSGTQKKFYEEEKASQMKAYAGVIAIASGNAVASRKNDTLRMIVEDVVSDERQISHLAIFDSGWNVLYENGAGGKAVSLIAERLKADEKKIGRSYFIPAFRADGAKFSMAVAKIGIYLGEGPDKEHVSGYVALTYRPKPLLELERARQIEILGESVAKTVRSLIDRFIFSEAKEILVELRKNNPDIVFCYVIDPDSYVMIHPDEEMEGRELDDPETKAAQRVDSRRKVIMRERVDAEWGRIVDSSFLIESDGMKTGVLRVGYSLERLYGRAARARAIAAAIVFAFLCAAVAASVAVSRRFAKPILYLADTAREIGRGNLDLNVAVSTGGLEIQELAGSFNEMIRGIKEKQQIKDTFSRYVSRQVADELLRDMDNISLGGETKDVTILFSDIRGFTTISEKLPADLVVGLLNEYFNSMVDVVFEFEGTLDKFIGDAIMAIYGSPVKHPDDPMRAVKSALKMKRKLDELNEKWINEDGLNPIKIGIGIHTGPVVAGNIGHSQRLEYTVIGDNVNLASRLESLTKQYHIPIVISGSTYELVKDSVNARHIDSVTVKGKSKPVEVYELLGLIESES
ncbi:MAG: Adenylate cyclase 1 [bacterium ADurb.Bin236]|nr:MAG: Adenylate cyclase 1 [bacterium ADurb.Bin236]HPN94198.1 adenylate/guanylate cyclase domain-containing protein [bacterium]